MQGFFEKVYAAIRLIPRGKVATYGDIARMTGAPRAARQVGWALHSNPRPGVNPCHRVVFADGSLTDGFAFCGRDIQRAMLEEEGVEVGEDYRVNLAEYRWDGK